MALAKDRNTPRRIAALRHHGVKAGEIIYAGGLAALDATGFAIAAKTAIGLRVLGVATGRVDNRDGQNGEENVETEAGTFRFDILSADAVTAADIGSTVYIVDDHTIAKTSATNTRSAAGTLFDVDDIGAWVRVGL